MSVWQVYLPRLRILSCICIQLCLGRAQPLARNPHFYKWGEHSYVDTVNTKLENFVFIIPMSKKIFDITGIEVIATPIVKIKPKEMVVPFSPIKYF